MNDRKPEAMDMYKVDLLTGKRELLVQNDQGLLDYTIDRKLQVRFATKKSPDGATEILALEGKDWKLFDTIPFEDARPAASVGFGADNASLYFSETRSRDTGALVRIDSKTRKQRPCIAEDAKADVGERSCARTKRTLQAVAFEYCPRALAVPRQVDRGRLRGARQAR